MVLSKSKDEAMASLEQPGAKIHRAVDGLQVVAFIMILVLPLLRVAQSDVVATIAKTERRSPAPFPACEFETYGPLALPRGSSLLQFPKAFERWFNDHLGLRQSFIRLYNLARIAKLSGPTLADFSTSDTGPAAQMRVIIGRDGWLFYGGGGMVDDFRRTSRFSERQLTEWNNVLQTRHDWLARRGIRYVLLIAPNQQTIYPEQMPRSMSPIGAASRFDQLKTTLSKCDDFVLIDPRNRLIHGKSHFATYHKTDTHWNDYGSFLAYGQLCEQLTTWFPGLKAQSFEDFDVSVKDAEGGPKRPRRAQTTRLRPTADAEHHALSINVHGELDRAMVLHDSFFSSMQPFFNEHWKRVRYVWTDGFPVELIEAERPQIVIQELVERKLLFVEPSNPSMVDHELRETVAERNDHHQGRR